MISEGDKWWLSGVIDTCRLRVRSKGSQRKCGLEITGKASHYEDVNNRIESLIGPCVGERGNIKSYIRRPCSEHCPTEHSHVFDGIDRGWIHIRTGVAMILGENLLGYSALIDKEVDTLRSYREDSYRKAYPESIMMGALGWQVPQDMIPQSRKKAS